MRFTIAQLIPDPRLHGLHGYAEVIESFRWGLTELGHEVKVRLNSICMEEVNILFGAQLLDPAGIANLPKNSIVYNLEQIANVGPDRLKPALHAAARHCTIWDYSERNLPMWRNLNCRSEPVCVPVGWSPTLRRIGRAENQDIDVLLYGSPGDLRWQVWSDLANRCYTTVYVCGLYGKARDELIARSKVVLNVNRYSESRVFEIVRVSYLLGNGKAVVSDLYPESNVDADIKQAVAFTSPEKVADTCAALLEDEAARRRLEVAGPAVMERRDIRDILRVALKA